MQQTNHNQNITYKSSINFFLFILKGGNPYLVELSPQT